MRFPKRMKPIIINKHEAVEWFKSKRYAQKIKKLYELNGFHVILYQEKEHWDAWFVCVNKLLVRNKK